MVGQCKIEVSMFQASPTMLHVVILAAQGTKPAMEAMASTARWCFRHCAGLQL
jgi:hypothetical protein